MRHLFALIVLTVLLVLAVGCGKDPAPPAPVVPALSYTQIGMPVAKGLTCLWSPAEGLSDPKACQPLASPKKTTTYQLVVKSECGTASSSVVVKALKKLPSGEIVEVR